jgi:hypothetical protein
LSVTVNTTLTSFTVLRMVVTDSSSWVDDCWPLAALVEGGVGVGWLAGGVDDDCPLTAEVREDSLAGGCGAEVAVDAGFVACPGVEAAAPCSAKQATPETRMVPIKANFRNPIIFIIAIIEDHFGVGNSPSGSHARMGSHPK